LHGRSHVQDADPSEVAQGYQEHPHAAQSIACQPGNLKSSVPTSTTCWQNADMKPSGVPGDQNPCINDEAKHDRARDLQAASTKQRECSKEEPNEATQYAQDDLETLAPAASDTSVQPGFVPLLPTHLKKQRQSENSRSGSEWDSQQIHGAPHGTNVLPMSSHDVYTHGAQQQSAREIKTDPRQDAIISGARPARTQTERSSSSASSLPCSCWDSFGGRDVRQKLFQTPQDRDQQAALLLLIITC